MRTFESGDLDRSSDYGEASLKRLVVGFPRISEPDRPRPSPCPRRRILRGNESEANHRGVRPAATYALTSFVQYNATIYNDSVIPLSSVTDGTSDT